MRGRLKKDLQALEKSAQRIKDLEKENAALGKSYDQMRAKAEKAAQATLEAASKAAAAGDKMHNFQENERYKHDFGFDDAKVDQLTNDALSSNAEYQKLVKAAEEAADKHQQLAAAQKEAEKVRRRPKTANSRKHAAACRRAHCPGGTSGKRRKKARPARKSSTKS